MFLVNNLLGSVMHLSFSLRHCCFFLDKKAIYNQSGREKCPRKREHNYLLFVHWGCVGYWFQDVWSSILYLTIAASFISVLVNKSILHNLDISPRIVTLWNRNNGVVSSQKYSGDLISRDWLLELLTRNWNSDIFKWDLKVSRWCGRTHNLVWHQTNVLLKRKMTQGMGGKRMYVGMCT